MRRKTSRVSLLTCPFCVRALLLDVTTTRLLEQRSPPVV